MLTNKELQNYFAMITDDKVIEIYSLADDFMQVFSAELQKRTISNSKPTRAGRKSIMRDAEVMTILVLFHLKGYRCLKHFYTEYVTKHMRDMFPNLVSYNRFVELQKSVMLPLAIFVKEVLLGKCTGISIVDSTPLQVCLQQRIHCHKVFKGIATRGHCSMGWFFGFKLHLICNDRGEILNFVFTPANVDDREPLSYENFVKDIYGKLVGDKGYISAKLFERLFVDGIQMITKIKKNMKNVFIPYADKILLRKRAVIESVNDELKNICQIEHSRHRSFANFITNLLAGIAAYSFLPKKPSINLEMEFDNALTLF